MSLRQQRKLICSKCKNEYVRSQSYFYSNNYCDKCKEQKRLDIKRKDKALRIMNHTQCGFCGEILILHDDFKLKQCLFSLRGYIIPKEGLQNKDSGMLK